MGCRSSKGQSKTPSRFDQEPADVFDEHVAWHIAAHQLTGDPFELLKVEQALDVAAQTHDIRYSVGDRVYAIHSPDPTLRGLKGAVASVVTTGLEPLYYVRFAGGRSAMVPASEISAYSCQVVYPTADRDPITFDDRVKYLGPDLVVDPREVQVGTDVFPQDFWEKENDPVDQRVSISDMLAERNAPCSDDVPSTRGSQGSLQSKGSSQQEPPDVNRQFSLPSTSTPGAEEKVEPVRRRTGSSRRRLAGLLGKAGVRAKAVPFLPREYATLETYTFGTVSGFAMVEKGGKLQLHVCVKFDNIDGLHRIHPVHIKKATPDEGKDEVGVFDQVEVVDDDCPPREARVPLHKDASMTKSSRGLSSEGGWRSRRTFSMNSMRCDSIDELAPGDDDMVPEVEAEAPVRAASSLEEIQRRLSNEELHKLAQLQLGDQDWGSKVRRMGGDKLGLDLDVFDMLYNKNATVIDEWWM